MAGIFIAFSLLVGSALFGQATPAAPASFTVASIKPKKSSGGLTATGAPNWVGVERWDVEAKSEGVQGRLALAQSLQSLLQHRFQLNIRRPTRVTSAIR